MRWDRNYSSSEIDDRRGEAYDGGGGDVPVGGILRLASLFGWRGVVVGLLVVGALEVRGQFAGTSQPGATHAGHVASSPQEDELVHFVGFVFDDVQRTWRTQLPGYRDARLVLFRGATHSACGTAQTAIGPFYCPRDHEVYIDLAFYDELRRRFGAPGDFAQAYVIAHEVGHAVQNERGLLGRGTDSIHVELQADCLAGAWAKDADRRKLLEVGDIDEALTAARAVGDDTLQRETQGYVQPEKWTHGSAAQRSAAFSKGYAGGAAACGI